MPHSSSPSRYPTASGIKAPPNSPTLGFAIREILRHHKMGIAEAPANTRPPSPPRYPRSSGTKAPPNSRTPSPVPVIRSRHARHRGLKAPPNTRTSSPVRGESTSSCHNNSTCNERFPFGDKRGVLQPPPTTDRQGRNQRNDIWSVDKVEAELWAATSASKSIQRQLASRLHGTPLVLARTPTSWHINPQAKDSSNPPPARMAAAGNLDGDESDMPRAQRIREAWLRNGRKGDQLAREIETAMGEALIGSELFDLLDYPDDKIDEAREV